MFYIADRFVLVENIWGVAGSIRDIFDTREEAEARDEQLGDSRISVMELSEEEIEKAKSNYGYIE